MSEVNAAEVYRAMDEMRQVPHMAHMRRAPIRVQALAAELATDLAELSDREVFLKATEFSDDPEEPSLSESYSRILANIHGGELPRQRDETQESNLLRSLLLSRMFSIAYASLVPSYSPHEHSWDRINGGGLAWDTYIEYRKRTSAPE